MPLGEGYYEVISPVQHHTDSWISIRVCNTGPSIDAPDLPRIFCRFYQLSTDTVALQPVAESGETGIGLSPVRELVVLMKGGLALRSQPSEGTKFVIQFRHTQQAPVALTPVARPVGVPANIVDEGEPMADPDTEKPVLLLVEDNEDVATYIIACVQADYQILRADNGQTGIDLAFDKLPDLILSDVMMTQKDGFQLCGTVKNDPQTSHIPVVLLTARAAFSGRISGLRRGADAYLTKPFQPEELQVMLSNLLQSRRNMQHYYRDKSGYSAVQKLRVESNRY